LIPEDSSYQEESVNHPWKRIVWAALVVAAADFSHPSSASASADATGAVVTTLAGSRSGGASDASGKTASFNMPCSVAADASGNLYVADTFNNMIRKVTSDGVVTTLAGSTASGSADGTGAAASFSNPRAVAVDASGNVYVSDYVNDAIRKITPDGLVTTLAGTDLRGSAPAAGTKISLSNPRGLAVDSYGNVYVADSGNNLIRKITPDGVATTLAGSTSRGSSDGKGSEASFYQPYGVAVDVSGNVYVADAYNNMIRKITPDGVVTTLAGSTASGSSDGKGAAASFHLPSALALDASGNIYVADTGNNMIRKITPAGVVTTLAGSTTYGSSDGRGVAASFDGPAGLTVSSSGIVYVADSGNNLIRKIQ
jgi:sugar lactone lactonase YvrE